MKKFAGRVKKVKTDVLGLDVHKDVIAFSHLDAEGDEVHSGELPSKWEALRELIGQLCQGRPVHVAMEASGGMLWLYDHLVEALGEQFVHVAQPRRIRAIANSQEKNDANDAYWLAHYTYEGRLPEAWIPTGHWRELRLAVRARREAVEQRTRTVVLIRSHLRQLGHKLPTRRFDAEAGQAWVQEFAATATGVQGEILRMLLRRYAAAVEDVAQMDRWIEEKVQGMKEVEILQRAIPGAGPVLAATIVAESGPIERFRTARAYARYTGMTPSDRSTGGRTIHGAITREGSPQLRWALGQVILACQRARQAGDPNALAIAQWVQARQRRTGGKSKIRVAAARKLATSIWWLFHRPQEFCVSAPFGGPAAMRT